MAAGTYTESVTINRTMTVNGDQAGVDARTRAAVPESIVNGTAAALVWLQTASFSMASPSRMQLSTTAAGILTDAVFSGYQILNNIIKDNRIGLNMRNSGTIQSVIFQNQIRDNNETGGSNIGNGLFSDGTGHFQHTDPEPIALPARIPAQSTPRRCNSINSSDVTITLNDFVDGSSALLTNVDSSTFSNNTLTGTHVPLTFTGLRLAAGSDAVNGSNSVNVTNNNFLLRGTGGF